jgi:hypothetical protein
LSSGGAIAPYRIGKVGSRGHEITVSAVLHFIGSGTFVIHHYSSRYTTITIATITNTTITNTTITITSIGYFTL